MTTQDDPSSTFLKGKLVKIKGLTSPKGKSINDYIATISGPLTSEGRYPVKILHLLTAEVETIGIKPQNLDPEITDDEEMTALSLRRFVEYNKDPVCREGHGRLIDMVLALLRFTVNENQGQLHYEVDEDEFNGFFMLPRSDPRVATLNASIYTYYRVKPSTFGSRMTGLLDRSVLEKVERYLCRTEDMMVQYKGRMAKYKRDGPGGKMIVRHMIRFLEAWDTERIHGEFWIVKIEDSGSLVVQKLEEDGEIKLGNVYLVKGIASQVGDQVPSHHLPYCVTTTFLPMYDFLVYDGVMMPGISQPTAPLKKRIKQHVKNALKEQSVIFSGESAHKGLWDSDPPEMPVFPEDDEIEEDGDANESAPYDPTSTELNLAKKIMNVAKRTGYKSKKELMDDDKLVLVVRRLDYTRETNPNQMAAITFSDGFGGGASVFPFKKWPTYSLQELLPQIFKKVKSRSTIPHLIWIDEKSLVKPLMELLQSAGEAIGFAEEVEVEWYPPPSDEEQAYHQHNIMYGMW